MTALPGAPGPIVCLIGDAIWWIGKKLDIWKEQEPDPEKQREIRELMESKGFHFSK